MVSSVKIALFAIVVVGSCFLVRDVEGVIDDDHQCRASYVGDSVSPVVWIVIGVVVSVFGILFYRIRNFKEPTLQDKEEARQFTLSLLAYSQQREREAAAKKAAKEEAKRLKEEQKKLK